LPETGRDVYHDEHTRDLGLRVYMSGAKRFFWFRNVAGHATFKTVGDWPATTIEAARGQVNEFNAKLSRWRANEYEGANPFASAGRGDLTLGELFETYCREHLSDNPKLSPNAERGARWTWKPSLGPWAGRKLGQVHRDHVRQLHRDLTRDHGPIAANRVLQLLKAVYNFALKEEIWAGENPATKIQPNPRNERTRYLTEEELPRFFTALRAEPNRDLQHFVMLALMTGARRGDLWGMAWADVSFADNVWLIPHPKGKVPYRVPLVPPAVEILRARAETRNGSPWVFPSRRTASGHLNESRTAWRALLKRAEVSNLTVHDLRRTYASFQAKLGSSLLIVGRSLGHASVASTQIYARLDVAPIRASAERAVDYMLTVAGEAKLLGGGHE
jgi:integrase